MIAFLNNGTYKKIDTIRDNSYDIKFYAIDISTERKGPVFTLVYNPYMNFKESKLSITLDIQYAPVDLPFDENITISSTIDVDNMEKFYNVYPLVKQMFEFNTFREMNNLYIDSNLNIDQIKIKSPTLNIILDSDCSYKKIKRTFKYLNMLTNTDKIFGEYPIIALYKDNTWEHVKDCYYIKKKCKYVLVNIPFTESCYMIKYSDYKRMITYNQLTINTYYENVNYENTELEDYFSTINFYNFDEILQACIFVPQIILMEQHIYDMTFNMDIMLCNKNTNIRLTIDKEEAIIPKNTCIFYLITELMKMEL